MAWIAYRSACVNGRSRRRGVSMSTGASWRGGEPERRPQRRLVDALHAYDLVAAREAADHGDARRRDARPAGQQRAERRVRPAVDRRRGHADEERAVALPGDLAARGAWLEPHPQLDGTQCATQ